MTNTIALLQIGNTFYNYLYNSVFSQGMNIVSYFPQIVHKAIFFQYILFPSNLDMKILIMFTLGGSFLFTFLLNLRRSLPIKRLHKYLQWQILCGGHFVKYCTLTVWETVANFTRMSLLAIVIPIKGAISLFNQFFLPIKLDKMQLSPLTGQLIKITRNLTTTNTKIWWMEQTKLIFKCTAKFSTKGGKFVGTINKIETENQRVSM